MKTVRILSNILFWITLISPITSFALASSIGEAEIFGIAGIIRYLWIMWFFIPVGMLSVLLGLKLKKNDQKYKKNLIVAYIALPLLLIFGSYRFIFGNISYDSTKVAEVGNKISVELPDEVKTATNELDSHTLSYVKITDKQSKETFESTLEASVLWQKELGTKIKSLLPFNLQYELNPFDYFLLYNIDTGEYNIYPADGEWDCIFIAYDSDLGRLVIVDNYRVKIN